MDSQVVQLLVDVANSVQRVEMYGTLSRLGANGKTVLVALSAPYRGLSSIPAVAVVGCDAPGRVVLRLATDKKWYAFGGNEGRVFLQSVEGDRREPKAQPQPSGNLKYLYSVNDAEGRHLYVGGWQKNSVLVVTIPPEQTLINAQLDNLGGDRWSINYSVSLGLSPDTSYSRLQLLQAKPQSSIILQKLSRQAGIPEEELTCRGYGFWNRDDKIQIKFNVTRDDDGYRVYERTGTGPGAGYYYDDYFGDRLLRASVVSTRDEAIAQTRTDINAFVLPAFQRPQYADDINNYDWLFYQTLRVNQGATEGVARLLTGYLGSTMYPCWLDAQGVHQLPANLDILNMLDQSYFDVVEHKLYALTRVELDIEQDQKLSLKVFNSSLQLLKTISVGVYQRDQLGTAVLHSASYHPG